MIEHKPECSYPDGYTLLTRLDKGGTPHISCVTCGSTKFSETEFRKLYLGEFETPAERKLRIPFGAVEY
jgi:hypothetical protein